MKCSSDFPSSNPLQRTVGKITLALLVVALLLPGALWAQAPKKVPFPFSPIALTCLPWLVLNDARIYDKYGIECDPLFIGASSALFNAMLSRPADFDGSGGPSVISNILQGGDIIH